MASKKLQEQNKRAIIKKSIVYTMLGIWALIVLFPFYYMIMTSFKSYKDFVSEKTPSLITTSPVFDNYIMSFTDVPLGRYLLNTLLFALITTAVMLIVSILAAFSFARLDFKGKDIVFTLFLALMMIPNELVIITNFATISSLKLTNTFTGLILPSITSVFYIYLLKENFAAIPDELYLAAKVDGTGDFKYLCKVIVPMSAPTIVTVTILKLIECWNSFVWPRLISDEETFFLVSNGIQTLRESGFQRENIPAMMAAVVIISLPLIVLFLVFRKKIMAGVVRGGTKG